MARRIAELLRDNAYDASVALARERGAFPLFNADLYLSRGTFAARLPHPIKERIREQRHPQLAPAVDRTDRHDQPRVRRQRQQRHRAGILVDLHAQEATARRQLQGSTGRGPCVAAVSSPARRRCAADAGLRDRARNERAGARRHGRVRRAVHRHVDLEDGQRAGRLSVRRLPAPVPRGVASRAERPGDVPAERGARRVAEQSMRSVRPRRCRRATRTAASRSSALPAAVLSSLRWPGRPELPAGNAAWTYMIRASVRRVRVVRRRAATKADGGAGRETTGAAVRGVGQRRRATARARRDGEDAVDGPARERRRPGCSSSSMRSPRWPRSAPSRCRSRRTASGACSPASSPQPPR